MEGAGGTSFTSAEEAVRILEAAILPGFEQLIKLQHQKKILAGGLPVGERAFVFILEAASNDEADQIVRGTPFWGAFSSKVTPLQSVEGRAAVERKVVREAEGRRQVRPAVSRTVNRRDNPDGPHRARRSGR